MTVVRATSCQSTSLSGAICENASFHGSSCQGTNRQGCHLPWGPVLRSPIVRVTSSKKHQLSGPPIVRRTIRCHLLAVKGSQLSAWQMSGYQLSGREQPFYLVFARWCISCETKRSEAGSCLTSFWSRFDWPATVMKPLEGEKKAERMGRGRPHLFGCCKNAKHKIIHRKNAV